MWKELKLKEVVLEEKDPVISLSAEERKECKVYCVLAT